MSGNPVVYDCDPGPDDAVNIFLASSLPQFRNANVVTSFGCGSVTDSSQNAVGFLDALKYPDIPVIHGASEPMQRHPLRGEDLPRFFGSNGFNDISLSGAAVPEGDPTKRLHDLLRAGNVEYFLTGPCTNLAKLILQDPEYAKSQISRLYIMGGALRGTGNEGPKDSEGKQWAEFNFYLDAIAANVVLSSGIPISLVTWDTAQKFAVPKSTIDSLTPKSEAASVLVDTMKAFFSIYKNDKHQEATAEPSFILSDAITHMDSLQVGLTSREPVSVRVIEGGQDVGRLVEDSEGGHTVDYVTLREPERAISYLVEQLER